MIRPYLRDLINNHKPTTELNNNNNNNNNDKNNNNNNRVEWKIQPVMQNNFISNNNSEDTRTIYSASKPVEIYMGSDTENAIDTFFNTILGRIQQAIETLNETESGLLEDTTRRESYIISPDWIVSKKATINPKNEKDNECFKWSIIGGLNHNKINEKELKKIEKFRRVDTDFSSHQRDWEELNRTILQLLLISYLYRTTVKK